MARTLGRLPDDAAARWGDREALTFRNRRISFGRAVQMLGDPRTGARA